LDEPTAFLDLPARVELMGLLKRLTREQNLAIVFSTHDLELALRSADTLWLLSGGRLQTGAPEDLVLSGQLAAVFSSDWVRFDAAQRTFLISTRVRGTAEVKGEGLAAILAEAVLEREGFRRRTGEEQPALLVTVNSASNWQASYGEQRAQGSSYRDLAEFSRRLQPL
jgi:iron complex transport system ATP-binding protein